MLSPSEDRLERDDSLDPRLGGWRSEVGRRLVLVNRARDFSEPALEKPTKLQPEARLVLREGALLRAPAQEVRQLPPALAPRIQAREGLERVEIVSSTSSAARYVSIALSSSPSSDSSRRAMVWRVAMRSFAPSRQSSDCR